MMKKDIQTRVFDKRFKFSTHFYGLTDVSEAQLKQEVITNRQAVLENLNERNLLTLNQVHGNQVVDADEIADFELEPDADAAVSTRPGVVIAIKTADCVPVLLSCDEGLVVGGAHCGWRSAQDDILKRVVSLMKKKGAKAIKAIIGPAIQQGSYEVDSEFYDCLVASDEQASALFASAWRRGHYLFDLPGFVKLKLEQLGVSDILDQGEDTYSNPEKYFSYRRDCHLNRPVKKTNILSTIVIREPL